MQDQEVPSAPNATKQPGFSETSTSEEQKAVSVANGTAQSFSSNGEQEDRPLVSESEAGSLRSRWSDIQGRFVDEPQSAVKEADTLVVEVVQSVARRFADERESLEKQWHSGSDVSTEDLRLALQHYRSFFQRLLSA